MFSMWIYMTVAAVIAAIAFCIGQFAAGFGVAFAMAASAIWIGYSVKHQNSKPGI